MRKSDFIRVFQSADLEFLTKLQGVVIANFFKSDPSINFKDVGIDIHARRLSLSLRYKNESVWASICYDQNYKQPRGWIEMFVMETPDTLPDDIVGSYIEFKDNLESALVIRETQIAIGLEDVDLSDSNEISKALDDLSQQKLKTYNFFSEEKTNFRNDLSLISRMDNIVKH